MVIGSTAAPVIAEGELERLFRRERVSARDERVFVAKLVAAIALGGIGAALALTGGMFTAAGIVLLALVFTHAVELQHQCLHHSAFRAAKPHRLVGVPLGLPLLVIYSHYRVRHLQHHRYLGTPQDSEFFGFDPRRPLTVTMLLRGLFDYPRLAGVGREIYRSWRGSWRYDTGQISVRARRDVMAEYRLAGLMLLVSLAVIATGHGGLVLRLWLLPLALALPLHFLVELPEHLLCDTETTDVLRNTRSIRGGWLSTWFTNGNNLHIEHHAAMTVPINRLPARHVEVARHAVHVERGYADFYRKLFRELRRAR
jgi:fatty acid desaturase